MFTGLKRRLRSFVTRNEIPVLTYHGVVSGCLPFNVPYQISTDSFRSHIEYLANNFTCVSVRDVHEAVLGKKTLGTACVAITFDDGFANNYHNALPILSEFQVPATVFVAAGYIDAPELLWPERAASFLARTQRTELQLGSSAYRLDSAATTAEAYLALTRYFKQFSPAEIQNELDMMIDEHGVSDASRLDQRLHEDFRLLRRDELDKLAGHGLITIGSHTVNHSRLSRVPVELAKHEIAESKRTLEKYLGETPYFAYPFGGFDADFDDSHVRFVEHCGYSAAFTIDSGGANENSNAYRIPRTNIISSVDIDELDYLVCGGVSLANNMSLATLAKGFVSGVTIQ